MKFIDYLEALVTNISVIEDFIVPTIKNKGTFWIPLKTKYTSSLQPKRLKAFHQLGIDKLDKFLNIKRNVSISTFTNTNDIDKIFSQAIGGAGYGLIAIVTGTPLLSAPKDLKSRKDQNRRWINLDKNIGIIHYQKIKDEVIKKIKEHLSGKEISSLNQKEQNKLISFYYKTVWETLKEKNPNNTDFYKHLSFGELKKLFTSKTKFFGGNRSNSMSYNEVIMNNVKIEKIYYSDKVADKIDTKNSLFLPFDEDSFIVDLNEIQNQ